MFQFVCRFFKMLPYHKIFVNAVNCRKCSIIGRNRGEYVGKGREYKRFNKDCLKEVMNNFIQIIGKNVVCWVLLMYR